MQTIEIDETGKILIPEEIRQKLKIEGKTKLTLEIQKGKIILKPATEEPITYYKENILVIGTPIPENLDNIVNEIREERMDNLI